MTAPLIGQWTTMQHVGGLAKPVLPNAQANPVSATAAVALQAATIAKSAAAASASSAAAALALSSYFSTRAAGAAAVAPGAWFTSDETGPMHFYKHILAAPYYLDQGPVVNGSGGNAVLFANLAAATIAAVVMSFTTAGYATPGLGAGTYVCDVQASPALAAQCPNLCQQYSDGRYFRLVGATVSVEQAGATGKVGTNDQPAIQAAYDYSAATGIPVVTYDKQAYEVWCPLRTSAPSALANDGHPIVLTAAVETRGHPLGTKFNFKNSAGGARTTITQTVAGQPWQGGGLYIKSASGIIDKLIFRNVNLVGGVPYNLTTGNSLCNLTDKGIWNQNADVNNIEIYNCTGSGFSGEIFYVNPLVHLKVDGLLAFDSAQSCFNPSSLCTMSLRNMECYNGYVGVEYLGAGGDIENIYVHDCYVSGWSVTETQANAPAYWSPQRIAGNKPPFLFFGANCRFERVTQLLLHSFIRGDIYAVDTGTVFGGYCEQDSDFDLWACVDAVSGLAALEIVGPATSTTVINSAMPSVYYTPSKNSRIRVHGSQTAAAKAAGRMQFGVQVDPGLYDATSFSISVDGIFGAGFYLNGTPVSGFVLPLIDCSGLIEPAFFKGGTYDSSPAAGSVSTYQVGNSAISLEAGDAGVHTYHLGNAYGYTPGQEFWFFHAVAQDNPVGIVHLFPASGGGMQLPADRRLYQGGDYLGVRFDGQNWKEIAYVTGFQRVFSGSGSLTPTSEGTGTWEHIGNLAVPGIAIGDMVTACSCSVNRGGVELMAEVSTANTLAFYSKNDTGTVWNPGAITFNYRVEKL